MTAPQAFDVVISFAGSERKYAEAIHSIASVNGIRSFLDSDFQDEIWGKDLVEYLDKTYRERGRYCLIIISAEYKQRQYARVERRAAFARMLSELDEYILPVRVDDTQIDGIPATMAHLDLRAHGIISVCELLVKKVLGSDKFRRLTIPDDLFIPRVPRGFFPPKTLHDYLLDYCKSRRMAVFGLLVYDERIAEARRLLTDDAYWDALDAASGSHIEIFAARDERRPDEYSMDLMSAMSRGSSSPMVSKLLKEWFQIDRTQLSYPSVVLFVVRDSSIVRARIVPFARATIDDLFLKLQHFLSTAAVAIGESSGADAPEKLVERIDTALMKENFSVFAPRVPYQRANLDTGLTDLKSFLT